MTSSARPTDNFRRQHEELMQLGMNLLHELSRGDIAARAADLRKQLARFAGKLTVHSSMEGEALYPRLLEHSEIDVRTLAERFVGELGGIYDAFGAYWKRWNDAAAIASDPEGFTMDTRSVLRLLSTRMTKETNELYPLVDASE